MAVRLRTRLDNDERLKAGLGRLRSLIADLTPVMDEMGAEMTAATQDRFKSGVAPDGSPWPELAQATKDKRGADAKPLVDRGHLRDSISWQASATEVSVGSNRAYARIHQFGGQAGRNNAVTIPARPYLGVGEDDKALLAELIGDHLRAG